MQQTSDTHAAWCGPNAAPASTRPCSIQTGKQTHHDKDISHSQTRWRKKLNEKKNVLKLSSLAVSRLSCSPAPPRMRNPPGARGWMSGEHLSSTYLKEALCTTDATGRQHAEGSRQTPQNHLFLILFSFSE